VIGGAPSTILSFAVEVVGTGFFLCMEKRFGFSEVFGGEGLVGCQFVCCFVNFISTAMCSQGCLFD